MFPIDIDRDGIGDTRYTLALGLIAPIRQIAELVAAAIVTGNDENSIVDVALGVVIIHILGPADTCFHVRIADRGLDHIVRGDLVVVNVDVFLAGRQKHDIQADK